MLPAQVLPATWSQSYQGGSVFVHWANGSTCGWRDVADEPVLCRCDTADGGDSQASPMQLQSCTCSNMFISSYS